MWWLVAVVVILILCWLYFRKSARCQRSRERARMLLEESNGTFDTSAREALIELTNIDEPTPADRVRRADIIRYNILESQRDPIAVGVIARDYAAAIADMGNAADDDLPADFMLHRIQEFNLLVDEQNMLDIMFLDNAIRTNAPIARREITQQRLEKAASTADTKAEVLNNYFDIAITHTNDTQNSHDTMVNKDLRVALAKFKSTLNVDPQSSIDEASEYLSTTYAQDPFTSHKVQDARKALLKIAEGSFISTFDTSEDEIFSAVWERTKHPQNEEKSKLMRDAIMTALADSVENGTLVCINGRTTRVLNSLATLDYDKSISEHGAMTFEAYKNQIFQETKNIINEEIKKAEQSGDSKLRDVAAQYNGEDIQTDPETEKKFHDDIKAEIDRNLQRYANKLSAAEISNMREDCYVFATI